MLDEERAGMRGGTVNLNESETTAGFAPAPAKAVSLGHSSGDLMPGGPPSENGVRQGQVIDRYRVVRLIASGGMSRVYEAVHLFTHKTVALKVMRARFSERQDVISRFRHEAVALSSIQHPNVVRVENAGLTDEGHVFIAMELLAGKNLREVLQPRKPLGVRESLELVAGVATGVAAAHSIGIIHRDLKPENIFCTDSAGPKVLDLGTAKFAGDNMPTTQTAHGNIVGTAAYVAPERLEGEPGDERCDIYSLGLVLYECIAGLHPMAPEGTWPKAAEIAARQISFNPLPIRGLPDAIGHVLAKAIHKNPEKRYRSMFEFSEAISGALQSLQAEHLVPIRVLPIRKRRGLRTPIVAGIVIGVAAGVGASRVRSTVAKPSAAAPTVDVSAVVSPDSEHSHLAAAVAGGQGQALVGPSSVPSGAASAQVIVAPSPVPPGLNGPAARGFGAVVAKGSAAVGAAIPPTPSPAEGRGPDAPRSKGKTEVPGGPSREDLPASGL